MKRDRLRNAPQKHAIEAMSAVRAKNDQIRTPRACLIQQDRASVTDRHRLTVTDLQSGLFQRLASVVSRVLCVLAGSLQHLIEETLRINRNEKLTNADHLDLAAYRPWTIRNRVCG